MEEEEQDVEPCGVDEKLFRAGIGWLDRFSGLRLEGVLSGLYYEMEDQANKPLRS